MQKIVFNDRYGLWDLGAQPVGGGLRIRIGEIV